jgi:hypothetical protein
MYADQLPLGTVVQCTVENAQIYLASGAAVAVVVASQSFARIRPGLLVTDGFGQFRPR